MYVMSRVYLTQPSQSKRQLAVIFNLGSDLVWWLVSCYVVKLKSLQSPKSLLSDYKKVVMPSSGCALMIMN